MYKLHAIARSQRVNLDTGQDVFVLVLLPIHPSVSYYSIMYLSECIGFASD
jgi:hypothetical protein